MAAVRGVVTVVRSPNFRKNLKLLKCRDIQSLHSRNFNICVIYCNKFKLVNGHFSILNLNACKFIFQLLVVTSLLQTCV